MRMKSSWSGYCQCEVIEKLCRDASHVLGRGSCVEQSRSAGKVYIHCSTPKKKLVKPPSGSNASKVTGPKAGPDQIDDTLEHQEEGVAEEDMQDKLTEHSVSQRLPLIIPDKIQRSKALIECDGDSIDLSGDVGAVGRIIISNSPNGNQELLLDLKGTIYKSTIVPSRTFCVVSVGQTEAKVVDDNINLL
uniref:Uncharacterized protein n=1 Tax=Oryza sativa subsp. japonica TaxID=39947 RepID=Q6Z2Y8_ORYSJ|nr:hypothetical protein [Oryza sativa Japonica Group]